MEDPGPFVRTPDLRRLKQTVLRPFAEPAMRVAVSGWPAPVRAAVARYVALPYLGAVDRPYERDVRQGRFAGATTDLLQALVYVFGVWEPVLTELLHRRLHRGATFVDVGANTGWYTTLAAHRVGDQGRVFAVEASPVLADALRAQVDRNGFTNVEIIHAAASDEPGLLRVDAGPAQHTGLTRVRANGPGPQVRADTLVALVGADHLRAARMMKVDVEGAEYAVVRGLAGVLPELADDAEVVVEVGPERASGRDEVDELFRTFSSAGFHPYLVPNDYRIRAYVTPNIPDALQRLDPADVTTEVNVLFSRQDVPELPTAG